MKKITACVEEMIDFELQDSPEITDMLQRTIGDSKKIAVIISDLTQQLTVMDRYERRTLSRRKFAIRELDLRCQQAAVSAH
jgi:hypothetical protein